MAITLIQTAGPVIAAGQSLSAALDCTTGSVLRIYTPAAWSPARVSFQLSFDGVVWKDLFTASGGELVAACVPNAVVVLSEEMRLLSWLKIRSGTRNEPVIQPVARAFTVVIARGMSEVRHGNPD